MRKKAVITIICVLLTTGSFEAAAYPGAGISEGEALVTSFESTGAAVLESTASCRAKLGDRFMEMKEIEEKMAGIISRINPERAITEKSAESGGLNKVVFYGFKDNKVYNIEIESVREGTGGETYAAFDVTIDGSYRDLPAERQSIINAVIRGKAPEDCSSCIIGTYKGRLLDSEGDSKVRTALRSINAQKNEGTDGEGLQSISVFSNSGEGSLMFGGGRVNIQMAMRYSSYDDRTYIWVGTPLIPERY